MNKHYYKLENNNLYHQINKYNLSPNYKKIFKSINKFLYRFKDRNSHSLKDRYLNFLKYLLQRNNLKQ